MTETEWLTCCDPRDMLNHISGSAASTRKLRLLAVAFCRYSEALMHDPQNRAALDVAERFADGHATEAELTACGYHLFELTNPLSVDKVRRYALAVAARSVLKPSNVDTASLLGFLDRHGLPDGHLKSLADLCRDVCGNPSHPINPTWLPADSSQSARWLLQLARWRFDERCRTDTAVALARQMYDSRDFGAMPILADALQDAGCDNPAILDHCRDANQPHVRGCWVCDLVLGLS